MKLCLKFLAKRISHAPSTNVNDPMTSSDSMDNLVTRPCFFDAHEMGELQKVNIHPDVDFLSSESPVKSASVYTVMGSIYPVVPFPSHLKSIPWSRDWMRYCTILFAVSQCVDDGFDVNWVHLFMAYEMSG